MRPKKSDKNDNDKGEEDSDGVVGHSAVCKSLFEQFWDFQEKNGQESEEKERGLRNG